MAGSVRPGRSRTVDAAVCDPAARLDELERLDATIAVLDQVRSASQSGAARRAELDCEWALFVRRMRLLTPQSYGTRFQKYLEHFHAWSPIDQQLDAGDATTENGAAEIKVSLITASNDQANFVQIRPHQGVGYSLFVVDAAYKVWRFDLTAEQMKAELELIGRPAHGVRTTGTSSQEWVVRFSWSDDDEVRRRFLRDYLVVDVTPDMMTPGCYQTAAQLRDRID